MSVKLEKVALILFTEEARHVGRSFKTCEAMDLKHIGTRAREFARHVDICVDKHARYIDT